MKGSSWRDIFMRKIEKSMDRITILRNHQGFLNDRIFRETLASQTTLCTCNDTIDIFRCIEESQTEKVIIHVQPTTYVPHSIQSQATDVELTTEEIFEFLNIEIIKRCGVETYDAIFNYCKNQKPEYIPFTKRQTEELIIRALFFLDLNRINVESCLAILLMLYQKRYHLPQELLDHIRQLGDENARPRSITLLNKLPSEEELRNWLSQQWQLFLSKEGKAQLNFADPSIVLLLPTLFTSGILKRMEIRNLEQLEEFTQRFSDLPWVLTGLGFSFFDKRNIKSVIDKKLDIMNHLILDVSKKPTAEKWLDMAQQWGQIRYLEYMSGLYAETEIHKLSQQIERSFREYILKNYDSIIIGSTDSHPKSVDKILPNISKQIAAGDNAALLVFDGMGIDQWEIIKRYLTSHSLKVKSDGCVYSMLPTLTGYSRQSIFSGKTPDEFTRFKMRTHEKSLFTNFWRSKALDSEETLYLHLVPDPTILKKPDEAMSMFLSGVNEGTRVIGVIFTFIDQRLHGPYDLDVGKKFLYSGIEEFLKSSCLAEIFKILQNGGYRIYVASDHGNLVATGNGVDDSKYLVETRGKRCLIYDRKRLAEEKQKEANVTVFSSRFIPKDRYILFPNGNYFFGTDGSKEITHGGISVEEMVVPFAEVGP